MLKQHTIPFDQYYLPNYYAAETLLNGNISECINYLKGLLNYGKIGAAAVHEELMQIYERVPLRYDYVKSKTFK